ncbi:MAG: hypothetical protein CMM50_07275 [Rhodospirillaceae bacterium]|nr:hypothetical protein [Rhodospirillaceae bacterium]
MAILVVAIGPAWAAGNGASAWDQTDFSEARLVAATDATGKGETLRMGLQFRLSPGWKMYWRSPGDAGSPPQPDWSASENVADVAMSWPAPVRFFEAAGLETHGYTDEVVFPLAVRLSDPGQPVTLAGTIDYQVCEKICIPFTADLSLMLPAGPAQTTPFTRVIDRFMAVVPKAPATAGITVDELGVAGPAGNQQLVARLTATLPFEEPDLFVEGPVDFRFPAPEVTLSDGGRQALIVTPVEGDETLAGVPVTLTLHDGMRAVAWEEAPAPVEAPAASSVTPAAESGGLFLSMLAVAVLGGLILNLMPCVLPVLSIKLLHVVGHGGGDRRRVTTGFLASAAGIVVSFLVLAAGAIALKLSGEAVGWGIQFQEPLFLVFLTVVLVLFAANLFGLYEIALPSWAGALATPRDGHQGGLAGHFSTGVFATLLATPCSAPFLGTALGFALARGPVEIAAIFLALGLGMALPYFAVAVMPGLVTRLPRPGPWMAKVRWVLGLLLLATAAWLLWVMAAQTSMTTALAVAGVMALVVVVIAVAAGRGAGLRRAGVVAILLLIAAAFVLPAQWRTLFGGDGVQRVAHDWRPFDESAIAGLVDQGKVVFVDVTADWCVTCKVNKLLVVNSNAVAGRLAESDVVPMLADWTNPDPAIAAFLARFDRYGIPFNVAFGPGAPEGITLPELLTVEAVLEALDEAAAPANLAGGGRPPA